jgi:hypothetical protein
MTAEEKLTSVPSGIKAVCVVDTYLILIGMALSMIGLSDLTKTGHIEFSLFGIEGVAYAILVSLILIGAQLYVVGGLWQFKSWAWAAGIGMLALQALLLGGLLVWSLTASAVPISYADGLFRWLVPLLFVGGSAVYMFDQRDWYQ